MARLIGRTKSPSLYAKSHAQLSEDDWALLTLYKNQYPDPEIEKSLCKRLYETASDDAEPRRRYIVDAMREVGSAMVLPTLEAILYDHAPTLKAKQIIAQAIESAGVSSLEGLLATIEAGSRKQFLEAIAAAITAIKQRGAGSRETTLATPAVGQPEEEQDGELQNSKAAREQAQRYLQSDPIVAIMCARRGAEALGKHLYRFLGHERRGRPARTMTLEELLKPVGDSDVPEVFKHCLRTLQLFGNFAAHDQDAQCRYLTAEVAGALLVFYDQAMRVYLEWLKLKKPS